MSSGFDALSDLAKSNVDAKPKEAGGLTEAIARYLDGRSERARDDGFHVSGLYRFCPVQWLLSKITPKPTYHSVKEKFRWDIGTMLHRMVQNYLADMGVLKGRWSCSNGHFWDDISAKPKQCPSPSCESTEFKYRELKMEFRVGKSGLIVGSTDGVVTTDKEDIGLEIKSLKPEVFRGTHTPTDYPIHQLNIYMHLLRELKLFPNLRRGIILYVAPMADEVLIPIKCFTIEYTDQPWKESLEKVKAAVALQEEHKKGKLTLERLIANRACETRDEGKKRWCDYIKEDFGIDGMRAIIEGKTQ